MMPNKGVIMVHAGAGYHSQPKEKAYQELCEKACRQAMVLLSKGGTSLDAVETAVKVLEDSSITNAGLGSALTIEGTVECDSSIMEGQSLLFGAVGAISGVKNPVCVARKILDGQKQRLSLGRIPPSILVGSGAGQWARENGCESVTDCGLITEGCLKTYWQHKRRLEKKNDTSLEHKKRKLSTNSVLNQDSNMNHGTTFNGTLSLNRDSVLNVTSPLNKESVLTSNSKVKSDRRSDKQTDSNSFGQPESDAILKLDIHQMGDEKFKTEFVEDTDDIQDTVGAVCLDCNGGLSSAVSSGGILLKHSGRVGQAAMYGAGCWAENVQQTSKPGVAISTSGCGEHLIRTLLARECAESIKSTESATMAISKTFRDKFLGSSMLKNVEDKLGGVIAVKHQRDNSSQEVEILWAHTTDSMCIGYMVEGRKAKSVISRLPKGGVSGKSFSMQGKHFDVNKS